MKKRKSDPLFAFFGTPQFSVQVLNALENHGLLPALVITVPDRPQGRGRKVSPSLAKTWALERGIDVLTPTTLADTQLVAELENSEWDVFVVAAYAKLLPKNILDIPKYGCLNIHPSLLPRFRGPSPILSTILGDERVTGVSIMSMSKKMDAGPVVAQARVEIAEEDWPPRGSILEDMLATEGGNLLAETMGPWIAGEIKPEVQDESQATYTKKFTDEDARIDLQSNPREQFLKIRAFDNPPAGGHRAYFLDKSGKRIIVTDAEYENGKLTITRVIPEGKKETFYSNYLRGKK